MAEPYIRNATEGRVGIITIDRPDKLNALNGDLMRELVAALRACDGSGEIGAILLHGGEKAFAAGADIDEMATSSPSDMLLRNTVALWDEVRNIAKPIIAAVSGWALGGGCELAMSCDLIVASETARFGQPEINIGVIPGAGGTQRLTRALGKARAMEMVLTGRPITAAEALAGGLVNRVVPVELYLQEAKQLAAEIAVKPPIALRMGKEAILRAFDTTLEVGLAYERRLFYMLFGTEDQKEGMQAFMAKRRPQWKGR